MGTPERNNVLPDQAADYPALDVAHGVPPPRAAPPVLRRVVLSRLPSSAPLSRCVSSQSRSRVSPLWGLSRGSRRGPATPAYQASAGAGARFVRARGVAVARFGLE